MHTIQQSDGGSRKSSEPAAVLTLSFKLCSKIISFNSVISGDVLRAGASVPSHAYVFTRPTASVWLWPGLAVLEGIFHSAGGYALNCASLCIFLCNVNYRPARCFNKYFFTERLVEGIRELSSLQDKGDLLLCVPLALVHAHKRCETVGQWLIMLSNQHLHTLKWSDTFYLLYLFYFSQWLESQHWHQNITLKEPAVVQICVLINPKPNLHYIPKAKFVSILATSFI